jgi:phage-related protein
MAVQAFLMSQAKSMAMQVGTKFLGVLKDYLNPKKIMEAMQGMSDAFGKMTESITGAVGAVDSLIGKFVALSNPGIYDRFQRAAADMQAVFGRILAPVMEEATELVRQFGDSIANASPEFVQSIQAMGRLVVYIAGSIGKFGAMLGYIWSKAFSYLLPSVQKFGEMVERYFSKMLPIAEPLGKALNEIAGALMELWDESVKELEKALPDVIMFMKIFADLLLELRPLISEVIYAITRLVAAFAWVIRQIGELVKMFPKVARKGFDTGNEGNLKSLFPDGNKSSMGAAAVKSSYTSFYQLGQQARQSAIGTKSPEVVATNEVKNAVINLTDRVKEFWQQQLNLQQQQYIGGSGS